MIIAHLIDSLTLGGAQTLLQLFAEEIRQHPEHTLAVISLGHNPGSTLPAELADLGARIFLLPTDRIAEPRQVARLLALVRREAFDVIHTHLPRAHILGAFVGLSARVPVVATLHSTGEDQRKANPWRYRLETWALKYGTRRVLAVGERVAQAHRARLAPKPIQVIPNAVRPVPPLTREQRRAVRQRLLGDPARPFLISVGRLLPPKAYPDLLDALARLVPRIPGIFLALVGDGACRADLETQARRLGLWPHHVAFLGNRRDVPTLLAAADLFVLASQREGLPVAVLEAMSAGLPVVATRVGDLPGVVTPQRGILVPVHRPDLLAQAVESLWRDPERRRALGRAGKAYVHQEHAPDVWVQRLLEVYATL